MSFDPNQPRGDDGKWIDTGRSQRKQGGGAVVGAAVLAGLMAAVGGGDATVSIGAALDTATSQNTVEAKTSQKSTEVKTARGQDAAKKGDRIKAWRQMGLKEVDHRLWRGLRCAVQSYGQVQQFFLHHPCDKLDQLPFVVSDPQGNVIVGTIMWLKMPSTTEAAQFLRLEDTYATGDVTPFGTEVLGRGGIRFTGRYYKSRPDGPLVVIAETEPLRGNPSETLLKGVATVADVLPPPP